jgi:Na+/proline symporter
MLGLHVADVVSLAVYLVGITVIGIAAVRLIHTMSDFFMPRRSTMA